MRIKEWRRSFADHEPSFPEHGQISWVLRSKPEPGDKGIAGCGEGMQSFCLFLVWVFFFLSLPKCLFVGSKLNSFFQSQTRFACVSSWQAHTKHR